MKSNRTELIINYGIKNQLSLLQGCWRTASSFQSYLAQCFINRKFYTDSLTSGFFWKFWWGKTRFKFLCIDRHLELKPIFLSQKLFMHPGPHCFTDSWPVLHLNVIHGLEIYLHLTNYKTKTTVTERVWFPQMVETEVKGLSDINQRE